MIGNQCKTKSRNAKSNFYNDSFSQNLYNPRQFWSHINNLFKKKNSKVSINQLNVNNNTIVDVINEHFSSVSRTLHSISRAMTRHVTSSPLNSLFSFRKMMPLDVYNANLWNLLLTYRCISWLIYLTSSCPHIVFPPYGSALELFPFSKGETQKI